MKYSEQQANIFDMPEPFYLVKSIASDGKMASGLAKAFLARFSYLSPIPSMPLHGLLTIGQVVSFGRVILPITRLETHSATQDINFEKAMVSLRDYALKNRITHLALPRIDSGVNAGLWPNHRVMIQRIFKDTNLTIQVCFY